MNDVSGGHGGCGYESGIALVNVAMVMMVVRMVELKNALLFGHNDFQAPLYEPDDKY